MSINDRIEKLEARFAGESDEQYFCRLVDGEYDHTKTLRENLAGAGLRPGAIPMDDPEMMDPNNPAAWPENVWRLP